MSGLAKKNKMENGILTIAIGDEYVRLASNLAYSFLCFNSTSEIGFSIVTNVPIELDKRLVDRGIKYIHSNLLTYEKSEVLLNKLLGPQLTPYEKTIMLDADCMIGGSLLSLFSMLKEVDIAVVGEAISQGAWHVNVNKVLQRYKIDAIYRFVGSFYFFSRDAVVQKVCEKALEISGIYDSLAIDRIHHNLVNEEVPISIAIAIFEKDMRFRVFPESVPIKGETMYYRYRKINLLQGASRLSACVTDLGSEFLEGGWPIVKIPLIIVFDSNSRRHLDYKLNATLVAIYAPVCDFKNSLSFAAQVELILRIMIAISLSLLIDGYNYHKSLKQFLKRLWL